MSDEIVLLTSKEYEAIRQLIEWSRNTRGVGLINTPFSLTTQSPRRSRRSSGSGGLTFKWCTVVTVHEDFLMCRPADTVYPESSQADFPVAKPYDLRKTVWDGLTLPNHEGVLVTYTYELGQTEIRTAEDDQGSEEQVVVPAYITPQSVSGTYYPGSMILAASGFSEGTRATRITAQNITQPLVWMDMNFAGRAWTENDE